MAAYLSRRILHSLVAGGLIVLVFLARLTGDPTNLYLPLDASQEARGRNSPKHGLPIRCWNSSGVFWAVWPNSIWDIPSAKTARAGGGAEAFPTTLRLAAVAMTLAFGLAIIIGALAAYRPGGLFDRLSTLTSLAGASAPDFWLLSSQFCCLR